MESINEEDEEFSSLGSNDNINKIQLNRYTEILKIKRKEMDMGIKMADLLTLAPRKMVFTLG